jgi:hypothetical protein
MASPCSGPDVGARMPTKPLPEASGWRRSHPGRRPGGRRRTAGEVQSDSGTHEPGAGVAGQVPGRPAGARDDVEARLQAAGAVAQVACAVDSRLGDEQFRQYTLTLGEDDGVTVGTDAAG